MGGSYSTEPVKKEVKVARSDMVVIPVDQSKQAEAAFLWYARHVHKEGNTVQVIHCTEWPPAGNFATDESVKESFQRAREEGKSLIDHYQRRMEQLDIPGSVHFELSGNPGESVVNASDRFKASHIVMGSRGFGLVRRTILGSVSDYVIHHSKIPVTVVPKETESWFW